VTGGAPALRAAAAPLVPRQPSPSGDITSVAAPVEQVGTPDEAAPVSMPALRAAPAAPVSARQTTVQAAFAAPRPLHPQVTAPATASRLPSEVPAATSAAMPAVVTPAEDMVWPPAGRTEWSGSGQATSLPRAAPEQPLPGGTLDSTSQGGGVAAVVLGALLVFAVYARAVRRLSLPWLLPPVPAYAILLPPD
jgi:hypothetical protein